MVCGCLLECLGLCLLQCKAKAKRFYLLNVPVGVRIQILILDLLLAQQLNLFVVHFSLKVFFGELILNLDFYMKTFGGYTYFYICVGLLSKRPS